MTARTWTAADDVTLTALHGQGKSCHTIAGEMGRSKSTISRESKRLGLLWERSQVQAATAAKVADAKARRAQLQLDLLEDAERLRLQLWEPALVYAFGGRDNDYNEHTIPKPTFADQLKIMQATGTAIDRSIRLADHDSAGAEAVKNLLGTLADQLGLNDRQDGE